MAESSRPAWLSWTLRCRQTSSTRSPLATAWRQLDLALNDFIDRQLIAA
jgi:hypothetical protein